MRMARTITLVLLGGGVMLGGATMLMGPGSARTDRQRECREARAANRADAEQICAAARTSSGHGALAWFAGRGVGSAARAGPALASADGFVAPARTSSRGGFGGTSRGFSSGS